MWAVEFEPNAEDELLALPPREQDAIRKAIAKLRVYGPTLGAPHSSSIVGASGSLRELRPRAGRSRWRAFYRRIGDSLVIGAIGPEAEVDHRGFERSSRVAMERLDARAKQRGEPG